MLRVIAVFALVTALYAPAATAADGSSERLRERLPSPATDRATPTVAAPNDAPDAETASAAVLANPRRIDVTGAVAISPDAFEAIFARYLGRPLTREDLVTLAREATDLYRAEGYFLSRAVIPPQSVANGVLAIHIEEGRIADIEFEGGGGGAFRPYFSYLMSETPARRQTLERALLVLGELGGITVTSSRTIPVSGAKGDYKLSLAIKTDKADGRIYADNRGEGGGNAVQTSASAGINGIGVSGSRLEAHFFTEPADPARRQYAEVQYSAPLGLRGTIATLTGSASNSVDGKFGAQRYQSRGTDISISLRHPVLLSRANSLWVNAALVQSNSEASFDGLGLRRDELSMVRAGVMFEAGDDWGGRSRLNLAVTLGRDAFRAPSALHPMARSDDGASFTKFTLMASRAQKLTGNWSLLASVRGQYSTDNLPEDEEISFGGAQWGRAFDYSEIEGDTGAAGSLEVRYAFKAWDVIPSLQAYAFGDAAAAWTRGGEGEPDTLSSAGLGLRAMFGDGYRAGVEAAAPLDRTPSGKENRNPRVFATISKAF